MEKESKPSQNVINSLQSIPFGSIIGGPLKACIEAQEEQSKATWKFIEEVRLRNKETKDKERPE